MESKKKKEINTDDTNNCPVQRGGEKGRSMVEMLGVLAVIGVISIGAIAGYSYAMTHYRTSEIVDGGFKRAHLITTQLSLGTHPSLAEFSEHDRVGGGVFGTTVKDWKGEFGITITGVSEDVCKNLVKRMGGATPLRFITKTDSETETLTAENCSESNDLYLIYNRDMLASIGGPSTRVSNSNSSSAGGNSSVTSTGGETSSSISSAQTVDACAGFTPTTCRPTCESVGGIQTYTYASNTTPCAIGSDSGYCDGYGNCMVGVCAAASVQTNYGTFDMSRSEAGTSFCIAEGKSIHCAFSGSWIVQNEPCPGPEIGPCAGFTVTTCRTACTNNNGTAQYTDASNTTPCTVGGNAGTCDGAGTCVENANVNGYRCSNDWVYDQDDEPMGNCFAIGGCKQEDVLISASKWMDLCEDTVPSGNYICTGGKVYYSDGTFIRECGMCPTAIGASVETVCDMDAPIGPM